MKNAYERILILDDDYLHNALAVFSIRKLLRAIHLDITAFTNPFELLAFIEKEYTCKPVKTILFLDIYITRLSGWDVIGFIRELPKCLQQYFTVYVLTNSQDKKDREKAAAIPLVKGYFVKPLSDNLPCIFGEIVANMIPHSFLDLQLSRA